MSSETMTQRLKVFASPDGCEHVIARNPSDAFRAREEHTGEGRDTWAPYWKKVPSEEELEIWIFTDTGNIAEIDADGAEVITLTAAEWIKRQGRGWLCSTEY